jgi:hypothetical protein
MQIGSNLAERHLQIQHREFKRKEITNLKTIKKLAQSLSGVVIA